jgi:3-oxoacyl-[acyl-carrier protein] reductase
MQIDLSGRTALITGAARGIGRAVALRLAASGANVVINYRGSTEAAAETVQAVTAAGGQALALQGDVSESGTADRLVKETVAHFGGLDILVNNAGITRDGLLLRMKDDDFDTVLHNNLRSVFLMTRAVLRPMTKQRSGRIISIGSVIGLIGNAGQANYAAAKAGLIGFSKSTAREVAPRGVTVNVIAPGFIETDMTAALSDEIRNEILGRIPLARFGQADDVADLACYLASPQAGYITGQTIAVDGGMVMS